jgi:hypothetical protein
MEGTEQRPSLDDVMAGYLDIIDRMLAREGTPLHMRPLSAAIDFVDLCILRVDETGDGEGVSPGNFTDYQASGWFRRVYKATEQWYRHRFGDAVAAPKCGDRDAVALVCETPFMLKVPMTTWQPGTLGESSWLCILNAVQAGEDVLTWVREGPLLSNLPSEEVRAARAVAEEVATKLRNIHVALIGMDDSDASVAAMRRSILPNLERAARHVVEPSAENVRSAHWDMQMACELALKCLAQQRAGRFKKTHDLFLLYDHMPEEVPPFARTELSKLSCWEKMAELRYGGGAPITTRQAFRSYRATLNIVAATTGALKVRFTLNEARIHFGYPSWCRDS